MVKYIFIILFLVSRGIIHHTTVTPQVTVILNGSKSYDPDGFIRVWNWRALNGSPIIANANDSITKVSLSVGIYLFELTVTDNQNAQAKDTTKITVLQ